jgi:mRNA interferase HigB
MHIIARPVLREFSEKYSDARASLEAWWKNVSNARWENANDVKAAYDAVDRVGECYVFNICRNRYRLIVKIVFAYRDNDGTVFIKFVLTHAEYDKNAWKEDCDS